MALNPELLGLVIVGAVFFGPATVRALHRGSAAPESPSNSPPSNDPNATKWI